MIKLGLKNLLRNNIMKKIIYIDMDGVISDFEKERRKMMSKKLKAYYGNF